MERNGWLEYLVCAVFLFAAGAYGQTGAPATSATTATEAPGTSTDLFVMIGSDFDRPGLEERANYNIGLGHTFGFLKKDHSAMS